MRATDLSISGRLAVGFGVVLVLIGMEAAVFRSRYSRVDNLVARRDQTIEPAYELARDLRTDVLRRALALRSFALSGERRYEDEANAAEHAWALHFGRLERLSNAAEPGMVEELNLEAKRYEGAAQAFVAMVHDALTHERISSAERQMDEARERVLSRLDTLITAETSRRTSTIEGIETARGEARESLFIFSLLLVVAAGITGVLTARSVRRPTSRLLEATRSLSQGNFAPAAALAPASGAIRRRRDELRELAESFGQTAVVLQQREARLTAQGALSAALAAGDDVELLAAAALTHIAGFVPAQLGALFLFDPAADRLRRVAGYAAEGAATELRPGEGLVGQAAASRERLVVRDLPSDTPWTLDFGAQRLAPRTLVAEPIVFEKRLVGVLLLASVQRLDEDAFSFVDEAASQLAVSLVNALANQRVRQLVAELEEKNELLKSQYEELQEQSEEIQAQNEELQAQTEEIQAQNEELQSREEQLLQQNTELAQQKEELRLADRQKDEFLSIASHELRTPITTLKLYAGKIVRRGAERPEWKELMPSLHGIERQASRLNDLVTRMLDASRVTMRRLEVRPHDTDLAELVRQLSAQAQTRTTRHTVVAEGVDASLVGSWDGAYLEQVITNLLENAIRYSPEGGEIGVSLRSASDEVVLSVTDHGIGIPEEAQKKLFRPYFRHDGAKAVSAEGLGLGLYVTHEIIRAHGGEIAVRSRPGNGTTFTITLPRAQGTQPETIMASA